MRARASTRLAQLHTTRPPTFQRPKPKPRAPLELLREIEAKLATDPSAAGALTKLRAMKLKLSKSSDDGQATGQGDDELVEEDDREGEEEEEATGAGVGPGDGPAVSKEGHTNGTTTEDKLKQDVDAGEDGEVAGPNDNENDGISNMPEMHSLGHLDHNSAVMRKRERTDSDRVFYAELDGNEARPRREPGSSEPGSSPV